MTCVQIVRIANWHFRSTKLDHRTTGIRVGRDFGIADLTLAEAL